MTGQFRDALIPSTIRNAQEIRFYQDLWEGAEPGQIRTAGDLHVLPVMDRIDYMDRFHLFWNEEMLARQFLVTHTSGTTGRPLYRYRSEEELDYVSRFFTSLRRSSEWPPQAGTLVLDTVDDHVHGGAIEMPSPHPVISAPIEAPADLERAATILAAPHRVAGELRFVEGLSMAAPQLVALTSFLAQRGMQPRDTLHVKRISVSSSYVNRAAMSRISAFWGAGVTDRYSLSEVFGGASTCRRCGWHHPDPFVVAEVVDPQTTSRISRGRGVLVLTELFPFVQTHPFIRYWTGDASRPARATAMDLLSPSATWGERPYGAAGSPARRCGSRRSIPRRVCLSTRMASSSCARSPSSTHSEKSRGSPGSRSGKPGARRPIRFGSERRSSRSAMRPGSRPLCT